MHNTGELRPMTWAFPMLHMSDANSMMHDIGPSWVLHHG